MVGVGRNLCGSSSPTPLPKQGHLQQAAQDLVQAGLEYLQRRRLHNPSGQPGPVLHHPQSEEILPHVQTELPVLPNARSETKQRQNILLLGLCPPADFWAVLDEFLCLCMSFSHSAGTGWTARRQPDICQAGNDSSMAPSSVLLSANLCSYRLWLAILQ